jgi:hypothetical protein
VIEYRWRKNLRPQLADVGRNGVNTNVSNKQNTQKFLLFLVVDNENILLLFVLPSPVGLNFSRSYSTASS